MPQPGHLQHKTPAQRYGVQQLDDQITPAVRACMSPHAFEREHHPAEC
jgi:hypothetical protein